MRILIIDDHQMFVDGLITNLQTESNMQIEVKHDVQSALDHLQEGHMYHFIVLDLNMPELDGFQFMDTMTDLDLHFPIVILSGSEKPEDFIRLRDYNIAGFIPKKANLQNLKESPYFEDDYEPSANIKEKLNSTYLSNRKVQILRYIEQGLTNDEIARKLFISPNTVKEHISLMSKTLNVSGLGVLSV